MAIKSEEQKIEELTREIKRLEDKKKQLEYTIGVDTIEKADLLKTNITNNPESKEWFAKLYTENRAEE